MTSDYFDQVDEEIALIGKHLFDYLRKQSSLEYGKRRLSRAEIELGFVAYNCARARVECRENSPLLHERKAKIQKGLTVAYSEAATMAFELLRTEFDRAVADPGVGYLRAYDAKEFEAIKARIDDLAKRLKIDTSKTRMVRYDNAKETFAYAFIDRSSRVELLLTRWRLIWAGALALRKRDQKQDQRRLRNWADMRSEMRKEFRIGIMIAVALTLLSVFFGPDLYQRFQEWRSPPDLQSRDIEPTRTEGSDGELP